MYLCDQVHPICPLFPLFMHPPSHLLHLLIMFNRRHEFSDMPPFSRHPHMYQGHNEMKSWHHPHPLTGSHHRLGLHLVRRYRQFLQYQPIPTPWVKLNFKRTLDFSSKFRNITIKWIWQKTDFWWIWQKNPICSILYFFASSYCLHPVFILWNGKFKWMTYYIRRDVIISLREEDD